MAVKIRMKRLGTKKKPFYRLVVADSRAPRDGRFIEEIGFYNPISEPKQFKVDAEKVTSWLKNGAKPTETVAKLFKTYNVTEQANAKLVKEEVVEETVQDEEVTEEVTEVEKAVEVAEEAKEEVAEVVEEVKEEVAAEEVEG